MTNRHEGLGNIGQTERTESTGYSKDIQVLKKKIMSLETRMPQFQAFADLVDYANSKVAYESSKDRYGNPNILRAMEHAAIWETIRQRTNEPVGFRGYKSAFSIFQTDYSGLLLHLQTKSLQDEARSKMVTEDLLNIKNDAISRQTLKRP